MRGKLRSRFKRWSGGWRSPDEGFPAVSLKVVSELGVLTHVSDIAREALSVPGIVGRLAEPQHIEEAEMRLRLQGRTTGYGLPDWHDGSGGAPVFGVSVSRVPDAAFAPEFGAVILRDGSVLRSTVAEALYYTPTLSALPYVTMSDEQAVMAPPPGTPSVERLSAFMAWGGRFNYGHFLLDCLSALVAVEEAGLLASHPPVAPRLTPWQTALLQLLLGAKAQAVQQVTEPLLLAKEAVFASPMDHFLHAPNQPLDRVRERILAAVAEPATGARRIYLSRRSDEKRRMVNELELEAALETRGFTVVHAGQLDVARQIALFRDAEVVVAPTGAALANCLFCRPGAKVFEIQPQNYTGIWVRAVCHLVGVDWHGYFAASPLEESDFVVDGVSRPGVMFAWRTPLDEFLGFLDERL